MDTVSFPTIKAMVKAPMRMKVSHPIVGNTVWDTNELIATTEDWRIPTEFAASTLFVYLQPFVTNSSVMWLFV